MHTLHRILANLEDIGIDLSDLPKEPKEEILSEVRSTILHWLDEIPRPHAFDFHSYKDAGRWKDEYPTNIILGKYDAQKLISELKNIQELQNTDMVQSIDAASKLGITTLSDLWSWKQGNHILTEFRSPGEIPSICYLFEICSYFGNVYHFDSRFFYLNEEVTIVSNQLIDEVTECPEDFAMVFIDCHI